MQRRANRTETVRLNAAHQESTKTSSENQDRDLFFDQKHVHGLDHDPNGIPGLDPEIFERI
jgi:hypothetical protein